MSRRPDHDYAGGQPPGARAPSQRQLRVGEELRHTLAQLLRPGELRDPALREANITVTEVRVSPDLKNATAYVMPLAGANSDEIMNGLKRSAPYLKAMLARTVELRQAPNISFAYEPHSTAPRASPNCCTAPRSSAISARLPGIERAETRRCMAGSSSTSRPGSPRRGLSVRSSASPA